MDNEKVVALREAILRSFPAREHKGKITEVDGEWLPELTEENEILDDEKFLYEAVNGRLWTQVSKMYLQSAPDGFVLLSDEAFAAFLPAWLILSLENMDGENEVREFLIYSFSSSMQQFRVLNTEQQDVVRALVDEFSKFERSSFIREYAREALALIDRKRY